MGEDAVSTLKRELRPREDLPGLRNFARVSDVLYRGEQPKESGFKALKEMGVRTVVNLRAYHGDSRALKGTGLRYVHIRCGAWRPNEKSVAAFLKVVRDPENQPVFVHCMHGSDRTGMMVASFRIMEQNWTNDDAAAELKNFGFHEMWKKIRATIRSFERERINALIGKTRAPKIRVIK